MDIRPYWLFLDMNSFFAAVEQQVHPELRGLPIAVAPVLSDSTCAIAASYEAKAYGIRTGTNIGKARRMCPGLVVVEAGHSNYIEFHKKMMDVMKDTLPNAQKVSVDEVACRLWPGNEKTDGDAIKLARHIKEKIKTHLGEQMCCSVGIAPNAFLAKVATELHKPNGLVLLHREDIPQALLGLRLTDLPGIGRRMEARLHRCDIHTVGHLYAASPDRLRDAWGGVVGKRWWYMLRGHEEADYPLMNEAAQRSISHSHILPPEYRNERGTEAILLRLTAKAVQRLRIKGLTARGIGIYVRYTRDKSAVDDLLLDPALPTLGAYTTHFRRVDWKAFSGKRTEAADPYTWVTSARSLWKERPPVPSGYTYQQVGMVLTDLSPRTWITPSLFEEDLRWERIAKALDFVSSEFRQAHGSRPPVDLASVYWHHDQAPERVAFAKISDNDREKPPNPAFSPAKPSWRSLAPLGGR